MFNVSAFLLEDALLLVSDVVERNIDSNPLRRRGKKITTRRREGVGVVVEKKWRKSTNFQQKFVLFTYSNNAHRYSGCPLHISEKKWKCK